MGAFPHPSLTPLQAEALTILAEECSELAQECSKILRMGPDFCRKGKDVPNLTFHSEEAIDVTLLLAIVNAVGLPIDIRNEDYLRGKIERLSQWSNLGSVAREVAGV